MASLENNREETQHLWFTVNEFKVLRTKPLFTNLWCVRFIVNSLAGVKLAEELCENPKTCLTILASESVEEIRSLLELKEPHYLINILQVSRLSLRIKRYCPHCGESWAVANVWRKRSRDLLYPEIVTNCCPFLKNKTLKGMSYFKVGKCVTKVNNKLKTQCGPHYSLQHMLSNLLEFDIEYIYEKSIPKWNAELIAKKMDFVPYQTTLYPNATELELSTIERFNGNYEIGVKLYCPEPVMKPKIFNVISPFPSTIWIILVVTLAIVTLLTAVIQRIQNIVTDKSSHHTSFFLLFGIIFAECRSVNGALKFHILGWTIFTFVLILAYSCNLRANLVKVDYEKPINSLSQMIDESKLNLTITLDRDWASNNIPLFDKLDKLGRLNTNSPPASLDYVNPTHCSANSEITGKKVMWKNIKKTGRANMTMSKENYASLFKTCMAFRKKNLISEIFRTKIIELGDYGFSKHHYAAIIPELPQIKPENVLEPFTLEVIALPLAVLGGGLCGATVCLLVEILINSGNLKLYNN